MRTTLTLDDDVAIRIERLRRERDVSLKEIVNDVLRQGLREMPTKRKRNKPFRTKAFDGGRLLVTSIDNIAELLAQIEGEGYK
jgi:hypothetical protein